jgi:hypothetical protein
MGELANRDYHFKLFGKSDSDKIIEEISKK